MEIKYFDMIIKKVKERYTNIKDSLIIYQMLRYSISTMVNDIITNSQMIIKNNKWWFSVI